MNLRRAISAVLLIAWCGSGYATEHWTAEVEKITVFDNTSAYIIVSNPRNGPSGTFSCNQNVVYVGVKNSVVKKESLAQVMMAYAAGKTIRFGISGTGDSCQTEYITVE